MLAQTLPAPAGASATYQINHYPAALIDVWTLPDRTRLTLRPVLPQDDRLLGDLIGRVSRTTLRNRFHGAVNGVSANRLLQMSCVDYRQHLAFVVTLLESGCEKIVADARYCIDEDGEGAEFALLIDDAWQRRGLGARAMGALAGAARSAGLNWLHGDVLASNLPMLALMQRCRFCCTPDLADDRLMRAEMRLGNPAATAPSSPRLAWFPRWLSGRAAGFANPVQN